ncbi:MAG: GerMN domain-containing protein [Firmicutes bacterium]|nr:GerMN domain-containing protein [Bacillota bacterium]MTI69787.1 GerMN domain-containing protein [Bacillota bacterium]
MKKINRLYKERGINMKKIITFLVVLSLVFTVTVSCSDETNEKPKDDETVTKENTDKDNKQTTDETKEKEEVKELSYALYLINETEPFIMTEKFDINSDDSKLENSNIKKVALKHLVDFKGFKNLVSPVPKGTKLLGLDIKDSKAFVNFSSEFVENMKDNKNYTKASIAAIVNTLTFFEDIESVVFKVDDKKINSINGLDMDKAFEFSGDYFLDK